MKYNLKNRPKPPSVLNSPYCGDWLEKYAAWFDGFEQELRAMYQRRQLIPADVVKAILGLTEEEAWVTCCKNAGARFIKPHKRRAKGRIRKKVTVRGHYRSLLKRKGET